MGFPDPSIQAQLVGDVKIDLEENRSLVALANRLTDCLLNLRNRALGQFGLGQQYVTAKTFERFTDDFFALLNPLFRFIDLNEDPGIFDCVLRALLH